LLFRNNSYGPRGSSRRYRAYSLSLSLYALYAYDTPGRGVVVVVIVSANFDETHWLGCYALKRMEAGYFDGLR
jgi:hypothetical protein